MKMQPGDWIAKEDIRDEEHLECIRDAVRAQGNSVNDEYGFWETRQKWPALRLDGDGDLDWTADQGCGVRIDPAELLGAGQTAYSILPKDAESVGHPAADILQQLADEAKVNPEPWREFQIRADLAGEWEDCRSFLSLCWHLAHKEVRRRPRTIRIGEFDVTVGVREAPADGEKVWVADPLHEKYAHSRTHYHAGSEQSKRLLRRGLIHLDPKSAETHGRALASLTAQEKQDDD